MLFVVVAVRLFALLCLGCFAFTVFTYVFAFGRAPDRPGGIVGVAAREFLATIALLPFWPLWLVLGASYRASVEGEGHATGPRHPVILLHGFGMNRTNWLWLGRRLAVRGLGPLYGFTYFSPQSVRRSARHLERLVERVRAREGASRVDIVAHSLGGLVARYFIERLGGADQVGRLVTIGSPHRGTRLGRLGVGTATRELHTDSSLFAELTALPPPSNVHYASVWSRADALIIPADSSSIAPAGEDCVFTDLGHLSMLLSPRVASVVADHLCAPLK